MKGAADKVNKKVMATLSLAAILICFMSALGGVFAEDSSFGSSGTRTLKGLGALPETVDSFSEDKELTRSDFADFVSGLVSSKEAEYESSVFSDVGAEKSSIQTLAAMGLMTGYSGNLFKPDNAITYKEAISVFINMMGAKNYAEILGGYPTGYIKLFAQLGVTDGIAFSADDTVTAGSCIKMMNKLLYTDIPNMRYDGSDIKYETIKDYTVLSKYRDIYRASGIVGATEETSLNGTNGAGDGRITIDEITYDTDIDAAWSLGYRVDFWYSDNDEGQRVIYIEKSSKNDEIFIKAADIEDFKDGVLKYYDGNKSKSIELEFECNVIVNGRYKALPQDKDFTPELGSVAFIDADGTRGYETVVIKNVKTIVSGTVSEKDETIYDNIYKKLAFRGKQNDNIKIVDINGDRKDYADIKIGDVLEIEESSDDNGRNVRIKICTAKVSANITAVVNDEVRYTHSNGETDTVISKYMQQCIKDGNTVDISSGKTYILHLNSENEIVYYESLFSAESRYSYVLKAYSDDVDEAYWCYLLDQSGEKARLLLSESFKIDGKKYSSKKITEAVLKSKLENKVTVYTMNIKGEITSFDTEEVESGEGKESLHLLSNVENGTFRKLSTGSVIDGKILISEQPVVFAVPSETSTAYGNYDYYSVSSVDNAISSHKYSVKGYSSKGSEMASDILLFINAEQNIAEKNYDNHPMFVNKVSYAQDDDGTDMLALEGFVKGAKQSVNVYDFRTDDMAPVISPGDILDLRESTNGKIEFGGAGIASFFVDYKKKGDIDYLYKKTNNYSMSYLYRYKAAAKCEGTYIQIADADNPGDAESYELIDASEAQIFVYDDSRKTFTQGSTADIISYEESPSYYSRLFISATSAHSYIAVYTY